MPSPGLIEKPQIDDGSGSGMGDVWVVTVFNNDVNTEVEVIKILMRATNCTEDEAEMETWEIDNLGKSVVHHGDRNICEEAAAVIRTIGIRVEVTAE